MKMQCLVKQLLDQSYSDMGEIKKLQNEAMMSPRENQLAEKLIAGYERIRNHMKVYQTRARIAARKQETAGVSP